MNKIFLIVSLIIFNVKYIKLVKKNYRKLKPTADIKELSRVVNEIRNMLKNHPKIVTGEKIRDKLKRHLYKNALFLLKINMGLERLFVTLSFMTERKTYGKIN